MDNWIIRLKTTDKGQKYLAKSRGNRVKVAEQKALAVGQWKLKKTRKKKTIMADFLTISDPFSRRPARSHRFVLKNSHTAVRTADHWIVSRPIRRSSVTAKKAPTKEKKMEKKHNNTDNTNSSSNPEISCFLLERKKKQLVFTDVSTCCHSNWVRYRWTSQKSYWNKKRN